MYPAIFAGFVIAGIQTLINIKTIQSYHKKQMSFMKQLEKDYKIRSGKDL